jgi:hypothetical protein
MSPSNNVEIVFGFTAGDGPSSLISANVPFDDHGSPKAEIKIR